MLHQVSIATTEPSGRQVLLWGNRLVICFTGAEPIGYEFRLVLPVSICKFRVPIFRHGVAIYLLPFPRLQPAPLLLTQHLVEVISLVMVVPLYCREEFVG